MRLVFAATRKGLKRSAKTGALITTRPTTTASPGLNLRALFAMSAQHLFYAAPKAPAWMISQAARRADR